MKYVNSIVAVVLIMSVAGCTKVPAVTGFTKPVSFSLLDSVRMQHSQIVVSRVAP